LESGNSAVAGLIVEASEIVKNFNRRAVLRNISFRLSMGEALAVTGKNGSGKSTLVKIVCGVLSPTKGSVSYHVEGKPWSPEELRRTLGLVSPYLQLYEEFSAEENLELISTIRNNVHPSRERSEELLRTFSLWERRRDPVRTYSSGMKQRLKYVVALMHDPMLLVLDEPTANLDEEGVEAVKSVLAGQLQRGLLIVATNDEREAGWCSKRVHVGL